MVQLREQDEFREKKEQRDREATMGLTKRDDETAIEYMKRIRAARQEQTRRECGERLEGMQRECEGVDVEGGEHCKQAEHDGAPPRPQPPNTQPCSHRTYIAADRACAPAGSCRGALAGAVGVSQRCEGLGEWEREAGDALRELLATCGTPKDEL